MSKDADTTDLGRKLYRLAAEGMAPLVTGAAELFTPAALVTDDPERTVVPTNEKPIDRFGPVIAEMWGGWLEPMPDPRQREAIVRMACMSVDEARRAAESLIDEFAPGLSPADRSVAVEYLATIPRTARNSIADGDESQDPAHLLSSMEAVTAESLQRMLPTNVPPFPIGFQVPDTPYTLLEVLGSGGFGAVYKAANRFEQNAPPRALKFCLNQHLLATLERERELLDRLMAAGRQHSWSERIVKLYGHSLDSQTPFLVYEFVPGGPLPASVAATRRRLKRRLSRREIMPVIRQVVEGLAFAHAGGLVHRDIKPGNVLVYRGAVKLTDFGIGGVVAEHAAGHSQIGQSAVGELSINEQACLFRGSGTPLYMSAEQRRGDAPDPRHDLYSLGVMWYQLYVGNVSRELHPGWADELREDFDVPADQIELIRMCVGYLKNRPENAAELLRLMKSETATKVGATTKTEVAPEGDDVPPSFVMDAILAEAGADADAVDDVRELRRYHRHQQPVTALAFSRDGQGFFSGDGQGKVRAFKTGGDRERACWAFDGPITALCSHDAEDLLLAAVGDEQVLLLDAQSGGERCRFAAPRGCSSCCWLAHGKYVAAGGDDAIVRVWEAASGRAVRQFTGHTAAIRCLGGSDRGRFLASGSAAGELILWDVKVGREIRRFKGHPGAVIAATFPSGGRDLLGGGSDGVIRTFNLRTGDQLETCATQAPALAIAFSTPTHRALVTFPDGGALWDYEQSEQVATLAGHRGAVAAAAFSPDGSQALSAGQDRYTILWGLPG